MRMAKDTKQKGAEKARTRAKKAPPAKRKLAARRRPGVLRAARRNNGSIFASPRPNAANFAALTPVSFLARTAAIHPERIAVIHGELRLTYAQLRERAARL